jgi:hypothetical protein
LMFLEKDPAMKKIPLTFALLASALMIPSMATAQKIPRPLNPAVVKQQVKAEKLARKMQIKQDLAAAKAAVKRGKPFVKRQQEQVRQASKNEVNAFKARMASKARLIGAKTAYEASSSPQNLARWQAASADYRPKKAAHEDAKAIRQQAQGGLTKIKAQQQNAAANLIKAQFASVRGPAKAGRPAYSQYATLPLAPAPASYGVYGSAAGILAMSGLPQRTHAYASAADVANMKAYADGGTPKLTQGQQVSAGYGLLPPPQGASPYGVGPAPQVPFRVRQNANEANTNPPGNQGQ